jgi:hypothetical protein
VQVEPVTVRVVVQMFLLVSNHKHHPVLDYTDLPGLLFLAYFEVKVWQIRYDLVALAIGGKMDFWHIFVV